MNNNSINYTYSRLSGHAIRLALFIFLAGMLPVRLEAQVNVTGTVRDSIFQTAVPGAVVTEGFTGNKTTTDASGRFRIKVPMHRTLSLVITHQGFETRTETVISSSRTIDLGALALQPEQLNFLEIHKLSDRSAWRDPVTYTNMEHGYPDAMDGLVNYPHLLDHLPGVYVASMGSQYGTYRLNIRGFEQQNVAVMLNGIPVSTPGTRLFPLLGPDGSAQQPSTIQVQKGTNNSLHFAPYAGGIVNFISEPARQHAGGHAGFVYGEGNQMHATISAHSGLLNNKFAVSLYGSGTMADGIIDGTWTEAWNYYLTMSYAASDNHRFEAYAMGAPQRYGQAVYRQHVAAYSHNFASEAGVPQEILDLIPRSVHGRYYNQGLNLVDPSYTGQQYWSGKMHERYAADFLNENEYYGHAPFAQLNWYADWSDKVSQQTTVYYYAPSEGSSGVTGDVNLDYSGPSAFIDYNSTIAENQVKTAAEGILSNSARDQITLGTLSRIHFQFNERLNSSIGIDVSSTSIQQYQEVRDLLGGSYYYDMGNEFDNPEDYEKQPGAITGYHQTNQRLRFGISGKVGYTGRITTAYASGAYSMTDDQYTDHMHRDPLNTARPISLQPGVAPGFQLKSGISFRLPEEIILYANYSYISQEPADRLIPELPEITLNRSSSNLLMQGLDAGIRYAPSPTTGFALSLYDYRLENNSLAQRITDELNTTYLLDVSNINQRHKGIELDIDFRPVRFFGIEANGSIGKWIFTEDATGILMDITDENGDRTEYTFRNKNLRTGNAPQLQASSVLSIYPVLNGFLKAGFRYYGHHFASWNPADILSVESQETWEIPGYYLIDLHAGYTLAAGARYRIAVSGHVFNLLDEFYITDALNNGALNMLTGDPEAYLNTASSALVYIGLPRTFSVGLNIAF
jgi:hypothetical protein